jgi:hypothetical protein
MENVYNKYLLLNRGIALKIPVLAGDINVDSIENH